jgi:hypothetical protein
LRAHIEDRVLFLNPEDVPPYKKRGSMVRNNYFWALRSIAARSPFDKPWEFESEVWFALSRMLVSFFESGYLGLRETQLEFLDGTEVPEHLRSVATWVATFEPEAIPNFDDSDDLCDAPGDQTLGDQNWVGDRLGDPTPPQSPMARLVSPKTTSDFDAVPPLKSVADQTDKATAENNPPSAPGPFKRRASRSTRLG